MTNAMTFEHQTFGKRLKTMCKVDFRRMFTQPLVYIMLGISLVMPALILIMTTMTGEGAGESAEMFTNVWQSVSSLSGAGGGMSLTSMCNMNLIYFLAAVLVCVFVADDFRSGYAKNLFTVRAGRADYTFSKSLVGFVCGVGMLVCYFVGAMIGGAIAGLPFAMEGFGVGNLVACLLAKVFLMAVFTSIFLVMSVIAKQRLWLSIVLSLAAGMLLFTMIPMMTPLDATVLHPVLCLAGGVLFGAGLGAVSTVILRKTSIV